MNPIANTAVFVALAGHEDKTVQKKIAFKALIISFFVIVLFAILGKTIFQVFGITISALRITGGVLVFIIGYHMLHGEGSRLHKHKEGESDGVDEEEEEVIICEDEDEEDEEEITIKELEFNDELQIEDYNYPKTFSLV